MMARQTKFEPQPGIHPRNQFPYGGERHAALLQIRKVEKDEEIALQHQGYTLMNRLMYGRFATQEYLQAVLEERVAILLQEPQLRQSEDPTKPNYSLPMFDPRENRSRQGMPTQDEIEKALDTLERAKKHLS